MGTETEKLSPEEMQAKNFALALAACSLLIECIDNTFYNLLFDTKYKVIAKKFQKECEKVINKMFRACLKEDEAEAYEQTESNIGLIKELFEAVSKLDSDGINKILDALNK